MVLSVPSGSKAAAFDISSAYRITPVHPLQQNALCIFWKGKVYIDRAVAFGLASSAGVFGAVADMLVAIYTVSGFGPMCKWVDDFFVIRLPDQSWTEDEFIQLTAQVGVPWSVHKTKPLSSVQRYIGFDWDLEDKTVSLPQDKLADTSSRIQHWLSPKIKVSMKESLKLHGKLVHMSSIFPLIRPFLHSISTFAHSFRSPRALLSVPGPVLADLKWIQELVGILPNRLPLESNQLVDIGWYGDASTSFGIGIVVGSFWGVWRWRESFKVGPSCNYDIGWAEAVAVEMGLRVLLHHHLEKEKIAAHSANFLVRSDNAGVATVINKGRSRSSRTNTVIKEIYRLLASHQIHLTAQHISGTSNITDTLSRGDIHTFLTAAGTAVQRTSCPLPSHLLDKLVPW